MSDFISKMTDKEILNACLDLVGYPGCSQPIYPYHNVVGLIIHKLQEWNVNLYWYHMSRTWKIGDCVDVSCLQVAFLRTAQALGRWSPPKKVEAPFYYWRNKISGSIIEMRPEFMPCQAVHPEEWQRVTITLYKENNL